MIWDFIILPFLFFLIYQDFKWRAISWYLIPITIALGIVRGLYYNFYPPDYWLSVVGVVLFTSFLLVFLIVYHYWRYQTIKSLFEQKLGLGDILFFISLGFNLELSHFIIFFLLSTSIALIIGIILQRQNKTIPLAGIQAGLLGIFILIANAKSYNMFEPLAYFIH